VAAAVAEAGADWVVLTNTAWGAAIDVESRRPVLSSVVGGYSGPPLKPIALRCVWEVSHEIPELPIVGCGGVSRGTDVVEYLLAGATAVAVGSVHFAEPRAGRRIQRELVKLLDAEAILHSETLIGGAKPW
jgi:dihydroorotate dehydrogenase (NAD+) catalytic subunit